VKLGLLKALEQMKQCIIKLTPAAEKYGNLNLKCCTCTFFPKDVFGGSSKKAGIGAPIEIKALGIEGLIKTDIPTDKRTGKPQWIFRERKWVRDFVQINRLTHKDSIIIERTSNRKYNVKPIIVQPQLKNENNNKRFKVVSLFSGCGGLDLGFKGGFEHRQFSFSRTKFDVVLSVDFDNDAADVFKHNSKYFGKTKSLNKDICKLTDEEVPEFDILLAGFPCQPFSNAGKRQGVHDENGRGTLFYQCERLLRERIENDRHNTPLAFVFENVRGILSSRMPDGHTVPEEIKRKMKRLGFNTVYKLIKASDYGVPQNRYRVIMVGVRDDLPEFDFDLLSETVEKAKLPSAKKDPYELCLGSILSDIPKDVTHLKEHWQYTSTTMNMVTKIGFCSDGKKTLAKFKRKIPLDKMSSTISKGRSWKNMNPDDMTPRFRKIWDNPKKYRAPNFYRRFALGEICGTITASGQPENSGITHPFENRRFTVREIARIQSFPDDFNFPCASISSAYKVIGNAVPPVLGWVIAKSLQKFLLDHISGDCK